MTMTSPDDMFGLNVECFEAFFQTMYERQLIWKRRFIDKKESPWTTDAIFKKFKFTNVYRELDRNSQYCINKIIKPNANGSLENLIWKTLVFRLFNNTQTFDAASKHWPCGIPDYDKYLDEKTEYADFMKELSKNGNIFTNAYFVWSLPNSGYTRAYCFTNIVLPELHTLIHQIIDVCRNCTEPYDIIKVLRKLPGVGSFISFELYNDLLYINKFTNHKLIPFSPNDYVNVGPGSKAGCRLIFPDIKGSGCYKKAMHKLLELACEQLHKISLSNSESMPYAEYDPKTESYHASDKFNLTIGNIEHWLCEYSKYYSLASKHKRSQRKFRPSSNSDLYS